VAKCREQRKENKKINSNKNYDNCAKLVCDFFKLIYVLFNNLKTSQISAMNRSANERKQQCAVDLIQNIIERNLL
jgi:hypothetical protein